MNRPPLLANLLNRLPSPFRKLNPVAQKLIQIQGDANPDGFSST
jgi:hypothetical protein